MHAEANAPRRANRWLATLAATIAAVLVLAALSIAVPALVDDGPSHEEGGIARRLQSFASRPDAPSAPLDEELAAQVPSESADALPMSLIEDMGRMLASKDFKRGHPLKHGVITNFPLKLREQQLDGARFDRVVRFARVSEVNYKKDVKQFLDMGREVVYALEFRLRRDGEGKQEYLALKSIGDGKYDKYLYKVINDIRRDGNRKGIWIRIMHEMNGNWYPWGTYRGGTNTHANFKRAYQHVVQLFRDNGADNVKFQLSYNCNNLNYDNTPFIKWWPGDKYVDQVLCSIYNRAGVSHNDFRKFTSVFAGGYERMKALPGNKPLGIAEISTTDIGGSKEKWFTDAFIALIFRFTQVEAVDWFFINKELGDWDLNTRSQKKTFANLLKKYHWATKLKSTSAKSSRANW